MLLCWKYSYTGRSLSFIGQTPSLPVFIRVNVIRIYSMQCLLLLVLISNVLNDNKRLPQEI